MTLPKHGCLLSKFVRGKHPSSIKLTGYGALAAASKLGDVRSLSTQKPEDLVIIPNAVKTDELRHFQYLLLKKDSDRARDAQDKKDRDVNLSDLASAADIVDYLENIKGYKFSGPGAPSSSFESYKVLLSTLFTYPLTLASVWKEMGLSTIQHPQVCIVGPEFEGRLGPNWNHLTDLTRQETCFYFVGPALGEMVNAPTKYGNRFEQNYVESLVEDLPEDFLCSMDAFVVFMPGAGTNPTYSWDKAFDIIRATGRPILLTAFDGQDDHLRDSEFWKTLFDGEEIVYRKNRFVALEQVPSYTVLIAGFRVPPANGYLCVVNGGDRE